MTETVPERLIRSLRTEAPYKHALEIMVDDLTQWLRDENVHDGDIFEHSIILGQGDYPTGRQIIENAVRKMNEAATALEAAQSEAAFYRAAGIVEIAAVNPRVMEYMTHWEGRVEAAQARIAELEAEKREAAMQYLADAGQLTERIAELEARPTIKTHEGTVAVIMSDVEIAATARREALEEAAKVAEAWIKRAMHLSPHGYEIERDHGHMVKAASDEIRALMENPNDQP